ncbi:hypothetical protein [Bacteroides sp.]|uniref:hypothetical protein n=1 Tax=Bacteroides sp. TaxID=29523 RepID=UPI002631C158|nr:hypothetical protein [Bacteroides sp.]
MRNENEKSFARKADLSKRAIDKYLFTLLFNRINPKKGRNCLPIQRKAVLLQADYYHKMIRD